MADLATLASLFSDITLHDADPLNSHILEIEFPVSELLSPNTTQVPHLDPPAALATHEAPPHDQQRAGVTQSICRLCLAISKHGPNNALRLDYDRRSARSKMAFGHLAYGPATSLLRAVAYHDGELGEDRLRLLFFVQYYDADPCGRYAYRYDVEISQNEWNQLVRGESELAGVGEDCKWVKALDELITRSSDRAYYHVRNRLVADYGEEGTVEGVASWGAEG